MTFLIRSAFPPRAKIKAWPTCEQNRLLFVWNDHEGNPPIQEQAIPQIDASYDDEWADWEISEKHIATNCRELVDIEQQPGKAAFNISGTVVTDRAFSVFNAGRIVTTQALGTNQKLEYQRMHRPKPIEPLMEMR